MRTLLKFSLPVEAGNSSIKDGSLSKVMQSMLERLKPEAAYFCPESGKRGGFMVFDLETQSDIPSVLEPLFIRLNASVELSPVMNADDLTVGLAKAGRETE